MRAKEGACDDGAEFACGMSGIDVVMLTSTGEARDDAVRSVTDVDAIGNLLEKPKST
jgi:hypothetical protein